MQSRLFLPAVLALAFVAQPLFAQDAGAPAATGQNVPVRRPRRPLPKPVNLQVLPKNIAPEDLIKIMRTYAGSLGVECNFCHAVSPQTHRLDFPSDAKDDKGIARTMIVMTRTINDQFMSQVHDPDATPADTHVTCATCHRGHSMPEHFVPPPEERHRPLPGEPEPEQPPQ